MTTIIGDGEDALTLWALSQRMGEILKQLGDGTPTGEAVVFYRPSFGRGERLATEQPRSFFGEFDAIIGTAAGVYLVETKVPGSSGVSRGRVELRYEQLRRHRIFHTYLKEWRDRAPKQWTEFAAAVSESFSNTHRGWRIVENERTIKNLRFVFNGLAACGASVTNVILLIGQAGWQAPTKVPDSFVPVVLTYEPLAVAGAEFFDTRISVEQAARALG